MSLRIGRRRGGDQPLVFLLDTFQLAHEGTAVAAGRGMWTRRLMAAIKAQVLSARKPLREQNCDFISE